MAATPGSRGQLITLPSFNNETSSDRHIDIRLDEHGKHHHTPCVAASWDTASSAVVAERRDAPGSQLGRARGMQDCNKKHMLVSERALSVEGGYQETNIALHLDAHTNLYAHKGLCENIPKQGDVGHVIYFASVMHLPQQDFVSN